MGRALTSEPLLADAGRAELLLGNEAIVRGALESGVAFACGYPGTPSSEITDAFARIGGARGVAFEYSVNEKIALEMAFAASLAGARSLVAMKHLGLMYAGDPLATIPYVGTVAGMVIVSAGDPGCQTSPNEQDQRHLADMLHLPTLDPSDPQEALEMMRFAFALSERSELPVLLRPTTRVCHTRARVELGPLREPTVTGFTRDAARFVPIPATARRLRRRVDERLAIARGLVTESGFARRSGTARTGVLATGAPAAIVADLLDDGVGTDALSLLHLGVVFPLPEAWLVEQLEGLDRLLVVEELSPYLEDAVRALCSLHRLDVRVFGKRTGHLPEAFEYGPEILRRALHDALGVGEAPPAQVPDNGAPAPRRPILCAGCGHRSALFAARAAFGDDALYFNDIGCYTLGFDAPLHTGDALLCMGAGFTLASGVSRVTGTRTVGFMGDSTFFHSGIPALLDAIKEDADVVTVVLDNDVTAMTGFQESPTVDTSGGVPRRTADIEATCRALGARHVETVDPNDLAATIAAFERARDASGPAVVIARRPCVKFAERIAPAREEPPAPYAIDHERCQVCGRADRVDPCGQAISVPFERAMARARSLAARLGVSTDHRVAPCAQGCPLFLCVQGYASHIAAGQYAEAFELIMDGLPLPNTVCRVCDRPCEAVCVRGDVDAPVAINELKRFAVDWANDQDAPPYAPAREPDHGKAVAVVGAGPAGLAAAHELRLRGYAVTLYDADDRPGGLLRRGVPRYRLPVEAIERDVARILELGVRFEGNRALGRDLRLRELVAAFDAVFLAVGAHRPVRPALTPTEAVRVTDALGYLRADDADRPRPTRAVVIGGGNAAIDAARTALRGGAERVTIACLERRAEMPAIAEEIALAEAEGIEIVGRVAAAAIVDGGVEIVDVVQREPGNLAPDAFTRLPRTRRTVEADMVIAAIGQTPDRSILGNGDPELAWTADGTLQVDPVTGRTSHGRVFAGGDVGRGPRTVTRAIAAGLRAAWGIDRAVRGVERADRRRPPPLPIDTPRTPADKTRAPRVLDEAAARAEAARCLVCGMCGNCRSCLDTFGCPAFYLRDARIEIDAALCIGCGVCEQLCTNVAVAPLEVRR